MFGLPRSLRRFRAEVQIYLHEQTPPDLKSGGDINLTVSLLPLEPFVVRRGRVELSLLTTRFSRTVLDGYHEHTSRELRQTVEIWANVEAMPGHNLTRFLALHLREATDFESRPVKMEWQIKARIDPLGGRELSAVLALRDMSPGTWGPPVVDGAGFLPLYEFKQESPGAARYSLD
jgi:hypothetical protein